jgi:ribokinase
LLQLEIPLSSVARDQGTPHERAEVLLNPAPARSLPAELLAPVDYLVPNETEAALLTGLAVTDTASATTAARSC